jgi:hypothetical protein
MPFDLTSHLIKREHELERIRTRALARQQWAIVIEVESRIDECEKLRAAIVKDAYDTTTQSS